MVCATSMCVWWLKESSRFLVSCCESAASFKSVVADAKEDPWLNYAYLPMLRNWLSLIFSLLGIKIAKKPMTIGMNQMLNAVHRGCPAHSASRAYSASNVISGAAHWVIIKQSLTMLMTPKATRTRPIIFVIIFSPCGMQLSSRRTVRRFFHLLTVKNDIFAW